MKNHYLLRNASILARSYGKPLHYYSPYKLYENDRVQIEADL